MVYRGIFMLFGWLIGLLLVTGQVTYYKDGHTDGLMIAAGVGILLLWGFNIVAWLRSDR